MLPLLPSFPLQLAEPAIRADCEGLLGRAWRSTAMKIEQGAKHRQASTGFKALYDEEKKEVNGRHIADSQQETFLATVSVETTGKEEEEETEEEENAVGRRSSSRSIHGEENEQDKVCATSISIQADRPTAIIEVAGHGRTSGLRRELVTPSTCLCTFSSRPDNTDLNEAGRLRPATFSHSRGLYTKSPPPPPPPLLP